MTHLAQEPKIGDRCLIYWGGSPDETGVVIARRETQYDVVWEIKVNSQPARIEQFRYYSGDAQYLQDGSLVREDQHGAGVYRITCERQDGPARYRVTQVDRNR